MNAILRMMSSGVLVAAIMMINSSFVHALNPPAYRVSGFVSEVTDSGTIKFQRYDQEYRLWGVIPDPAALRSFIEDEWLTCIAWGMNTAEDERTAISCWMNEDDRLEMDIAFKLIRMGAAIENCEESKGMYGQCPELQRETPIPNQDS